MSRMTIVNQKDGSFPTMHEALEKLYEHRSPDSLWGDHESKLSPGVNRRHHVQGKPLACPAHHRGLTNWCPSGARMKIRTNPRLVSKENLRPLPYSPCPNLRILLFHPLLDQRPILLKRLGPRPLAAQPQLRQQPTHRSQIQLHPILPWRSQLRRARSCRWKAR